MTSVSLLPDRTLLLPELPRSEIRAFSHRLELLPNDGGMDLGAVEGLRREAAIGACDHVLATDQLGKTQEPLGDSSGCSTILLAWVMTPGMSTLPSGTLTRSKRWYSCSCRGLAASKLYDPALIFST